MTDSKDLPSQNTVSSRYAPGEIERSAQKRWLEGAYFKANPSSAGKPYSIVIPPPNVTGYLHIGHALNNTLQDILIRWRRMQGWNTLWIPGTDHAGIATQHVVERSLREQGQDRRDMTREAFVERVWEWKEQYGSRIIHQLERLGCSCDWSRTRFTMDEGLSSAVMLVFKKLFDEGLIYRGSYLVNWSPKLQTALSDDEVVYKEVKSHLWHLNYPLEDGCGVIQVATTRPETMLGDTAVAVHPDDPRYLAFHGKKVRLPLTGRLIPVIPDTMVDQTFGTGAVKVTPAHDPNDYEMGRRRNLEFINILNPDGTLNEHAGRYAGLETAVARKQIVKDLEAEGALAKIEPYTHSVGHCYRSDCVIEPYMSKQWFVKMQPLTEQALEAVRDGRIEFVPKHYENIYFHWLENVRDWCISRQLWWGHRIPVFECEACEHIWCEIDTHPTKCPKCQSSKITQDPDVLDTWFSSALWPFSTMGWPEQTIELKTYYPTCVLVTAHDIIFFWVARMIMMGLKFMDQVPFAKVVINPMVMDEHGKKMSKSSGTAIDPLETVEEIGADALRLTLAGYPTQSRQISLSEKRMETLRNFNNKLWNASRFVLMNVEDLSAEAFSKNTATDMFEDRWILGRLTQTLERINVALEAFAFDDYVDALYKFIWNEYCDWYLELVKDRLNQKADGLRGTAESRQSAQVILVTVLEQTLRMLHPVAPHISEELWQTLRARWHNVQIFSSPSIMVASWPQSGQFDHVVDAQMALIQETIGRIRNIRGEMGVPPAMKIAVEIVSQNTERLNVLKRAETYLTSLSGIESISFGPSKQGQGFASTSAIEDITIWVYVPQELRDQECLRLDKEIARLEKGVLGAQSKLQNTKFIEGAPEDVVNAERKRLVGMEAELATLRDRRASLN